MYYLLRKTLFLFKPEKAHYLSLGVLSFLLKLPLLGLIVKRSLGKARHKKTTVFGLDFKNPIGLAAGFDKDARFIHVFEAIGFGYVEIGTLTPKAQLGNPKPRLFRLPEDKAIINRMGFNNHGVDAAIEQLKKRKTSIIVGGNIGKNKNTSNENAANDYLICFTKLYNYVDYFVVNVSSPNTPGLRKLQDTESLTKIFDALHNARKAFIKNGKKSKVILLKIAPDLADEQVKEIATLVLKIGIDGVIATNTTISREGLKTDAEIVKNIGNGGLSGMPVREQSTHVLALLKKELGDKVPLIGVGGICSLEDGIEKIDAGANLIQVYSGFIYEGPKLIKNLASLSV